MALCCARPAPKKVDYWRHAHVAILVCVNCKTKWMVRKRRD